MHHEVAVKTFFTYTVHERLCAYPCIRQLGVQRVKHIIVRFAKEQAVSRTSGVVIVIS